MRCPRNRVNFNAATVYPAEPLDVCAPIGWQILFDNSAGDQVVGISVLVHVVRVHVDQQPFTQFDLFAVYVAPAICL
jgi:hypothetical protein